MHNTCSTTSVPNYVTVASRSTEILLFEFLELSTFGEVSTLVIAFLEGNLKNRSPTSCSSGPILSLSTITFELHAKTAEEIDLEKYNFRNFRSSVTLTVTLDRVEVTLVRIRGWGLPTHQIRWKSEKLFVDVRTDTPRFQSTIGHR